MGSHGDTEFLIASDWNALNHEATTTAKGPDGDLDSSTGEKCAEAEVHSSTPTATVLTSTTFADVTPNKQRVPPPSELTPPASLPSTPQKKFAHPAHGQGDTYVPGPVGSVLVSPIVVYLVFQI